MNITQKINNDAVTLAGNINLHNASDVKDVIHKLIEKRVYMLLLILKRFRI